METNLGQFIIFSRPKPPKVSTSQQDHLNDTFCIQKRSEPHLELPYSSKKK